MENPTCRIGTGHFKGNRTIKERFLFAPTIIVMWVKAKPCSDDRSFPIGELFKFRYYDRHGIAVQIEMLTKNGRIVLQFFADGIQNGTNSPNLVNAVCQNSSPFTFLLGTLIILKKGSRPMGEVTPTGRQKVICRSRSCKGFSLRHRS